MSCRLSFFFYIISFCSLEYTILQATLTTPSPPLTFSIELPQSSYAGLCEVSCLPAVINRLKISTDTLLTPLEATYLLPFKEGDILTKAALEKFVEYLAIKNKFSEVSFSLQPLSNSSPLTLDVLIELKSVWTFDRVIFHGPLQNKEQYRQFYLLESGEIFNKKKHDHSLRTIKENLAGQGFFEARMAHYCTYDQATKIIKVIIVIDPGRKFVIEDLNSVISGDSLVEAESALVRSTVQKMLSKALRGTIYSHQKLNDHVGTLKKYLVKKGYIDTVIRIKESVNYATASVSILVQIIIQKKRKFSFEGNTILTKKVLLECLESFGSALSFIPLSLVKEELLLLYKKKGFLNTVISITESTDNNFLITVYEGTGTTIRSLVFKGDLSFPSEKLMEIFRGALKTNLLEEDALREGLESLRQFYTTQGFWEASLQHEIIPGTNPNNVDVHVSLIEGPHYFLDAVEVKTDAQDSFCFPSSLYTPVNKAFDPSIIAAQRQLLMNYFHERGYLYATLRHELTSVQHDSHRMQLVWWVEGVAEQVRFGKMIFQGSSHFAFANIAREMAFKEGDLWSQERLRESLSRLMNLGVFESVHLYPHQIETPEATKIVVAKIVADEPFEARLRLGFQQVSKTFLAFRQGTTYKVGGSLLYKNPTQAADILCVEGDITRFYRNISASYQRPWLFSSPIRTLIKGYTNKYIQPLYIGSDKPLYQATQQGFLIGLRRRWPLIDIGVTLGNEWMETNHLSYQLAQAINFEPALIDKKVPYVFVEPDIAINCLDNQLNPTKGFLTVFSAKVMIPWQRLKPTQGFFKLLFDQSLFIPLSASMTGGFRFRFGHIFNTDFNRIMPPERFYLGGQNSIRSYQPDFAPPLGICINENGKEQLVPRGGRSVFTLNLEVRTIVWRALSVVLFQDLGTLVGSLENHSSLSHLVAGTGFGLRYLTPIGPIRFDIAWKWKKLYVQEPAYAWFLTLGHAF